MAVGGATQRGAAAPGQVAPRCHSRRSRYLRWQLERWAVGFFRLVLMPARAEQMTALLFTLLAALTLAGEPGAGTGEFVLLEASATFYRVAG